MDIEVASELHYMCSGKHFVSLRFIDYWHSILIYELGSPTILSLIFTSLLICYSVFSFLLCLGNGVLGLFSQLFLIHESCLTLSNSFVGFIYEMMRSSNRRHYSCKVYPSLTPFCSLFNSIASTFWDIVTYDLPSI